MDNASAGKEVLFGRIAVHHGFLTTEQLDDCLEQQRERKARGRTPHLGSIAVELGFLDANDCKKILEIQRINLAPENPREAGRRSNRIFGYLIYQSGHCTEEQIFACIREQARLDKIGLKFKLGEVFVNAKYLTTDQVQELLKLQHKSILRCEKCQAQFNVVGFEPGAGVACPKCNAQLHMPDFLETVKVEGEAIAPGAAAAEAELVSTELDAEEARMIERLTSQDVIAKWGQKAPSISGEIQRQLGLLEKLEGMLADYVALVETLPQTPGRDKMGRASDALLAAQADFRATLEAAADASGVSHD
jgi:hypothetical protein